MAGMFLKLIVLPGLVIVAIIASIAWMTSPGSDVESLIEELAQEGHGRLPAAVDLVARLNDSDNTMLRRDPVLARRLSAILDAEIQRAGMEPEDLRLRMYLSRALGTFETSESLPGLLTAAGTQRNEAEVDVRLGALRAVALLVDNVGAATIRDRPRLLRVLSACAEDGRAPVRQRAAFALGVVGGRAAEKRLETMLADRSPEVRYNAATGLARHGNAAGLDVLVEMLDPDRDSGGNFPRARIQLSALEALGKLAEAGAQTDPDRLMPLVERLTRADVETPVRVKAVEVVRAWGNDFDGWVSPGAK